MDIKQVLKNYGLGEDETKLYLAALKMGESPLSLIAKEAAIKRSSAYLVAKNLEQKGLLGSFRMRSGLRFVASPPSLLVERLNRRIEEVREILPELKAIQGGSQSKPKITFYEGEEGYFAILEDSLKTTDGIIRCVGSLEKLYEIIGKGYDDKYYIPNRLKNRIRYKGLHFEEEAKNIFTPERNEKELREVKFLPKNYSHPTFIMIYQNTLAIFTSKKELIAIKIESEEIAKSEKDKFDLIWNLLK
jgi:HTH-type transcriptional regulator, sugar sensing transcriptional regulator